MSKSNTFENDLLKLIFNGDTIANLADDAASGPLANLYVSLHTANPNEGGDQTTSEISYTGYARVAVSRDTDGFTVSGNQVTFAEDVTFGEMTAGAGGTVTHFAIGTASSGSGKILYYGTVTPNLAVVNGAVPELTTSTAITED